MLNFGYWNGAMDPITAQSNLCSLVSDTAELGSGHRLLDIGSGFGAPAEHWKSKYPFLDVSCININLSQLLATPAGKVSLLNATSTILPFSDLSIDRIIALESAQHFKPFNNFVKECKRVLMPGGMLVIAMPVIKNAHPLGLGILSWTWSSEHYKAEYVRSALEQNGFDIQDIKYIGHNVYEPLTNYYIRERVSLRRRILERYPSFLENILYKSLLKMKQVSEKEMIDYIVVKAK